MGVEGKSEVEGGGMHHGMFMLKQKPACRSLTKLEAGWSAAGRESVRGKV